VKKTNLIFALLLFSGTINASTTNTQAITGFGTSAAPSWTVCNGGVWMAWKGDGSDTAIYAASTYTGVKPAVKGGSQQESPYGGTLDNPNYYLFTSQMKVTSIAGGVPMTVVTGALGEKLRTTVVNDAKPISVTIPSTDNSPAITCMGDTLYLFWRNSPDGVIYWAQSKSPVESKVPGQSGAAPLMSWTNIEPVNLYGVQAPSLNTSVTTTLQVKTGKTSSAPSVASGDGTIYLAFKGDTDGKIYYATFNHTTNLGQWSTASVYSTAGSNWDSQTADVPLTSDSPAITVSGDRVVFAWKGANDNQLWWSQIAHVPVAPAGAKGAGSPVFNMPSRAVGWTSRLIASATSNVPPALVVDGNGVVWISWIPVPGTIGGSEEILPPIAFANLLTNQGPYDGGVWSIPALRVGMPTGVGFRPALVSTGNDSTDIMIAWKNPGNDAGITIGPMRLPATVYTFSISSVTAINTRSGSIASHLGPFSVASADTDFVSLSATASGGTAVSSCSCGNTSGSASGAWMLGNLENGQSNTPSDVGPNGTAGGPGGDVSITVPDDDQVVFNYLVNNYGEGSASSAVQLLQMASQKLVTAGASAAASLAGTALAAAIGSAIGTGTVPFVGSALGALAGWVVGDAWGIAFPYCDGPVAAGVHVYSAYDLHTMTSSTAIPATNLQTGQDVVRPNSYYEVDVSPAPGSAPITTQSGCGSNPIYKVQWTISRGRHVNGGGATD
jgi:hypothetical protein